MKLKKCCLWSWTIFLLSIAIAVTLWLTLKDKGAENGSESNSGSNSTGGGSAGGGGATETVPIDFFQALIVEESSCKLTAIDINNQETTVKLNLSNKSTDVCSFDFYLKETIIYNNDAIKIKSTSDEYPEIVLPANYHSIEFSTSNTYIVAVDFISKKVYAISKYKRQESDKLIVVDLYGKYYGIILADLNEPKQLALDPSLGLLFIGQLSSILRANMDGTSARIIIQKNGITELALDRQTKRIYWASQLNIESSDYEGTDIRVISPIASSITSLTYVDDQLFWLMPPYGMNPNTTLWTCKMQNRVCGRTNEMPSDKPQLLKTYDFEEVRTTVATTNNPCKGPENGGCQQLCLLTSDTKGHSCACALGYRLNEDLKSCSSATGEFLLYAQGSYARGKIIDPVWPTNETTGFTEVIYPVYLDTKYLERNKVIHFDFDFHDNYFYFSDDVGIYDRSLVATTKQFQIRTDITPEYKMYIANDWMSRNFYSTRTRHYYLKDNDIIVFLYSFGTVNRDFKTLRKFDRAYKPRSIVVHPNRGHVFFILVNATANNAQIYKMNTDGTNMVQFMKDHYVREVGLAIDFSEDRLYWFTEDGKKLENVKLDDPSNTITSVDISQVENAETVNLSKRWIYLTNLTSIWQLNKVTGGNALRLASTQPESPEMIAGARVYSREAQPLVNEHPCSAGNGGCQQFCFAVPEEDESATRILGSPRLRRQCGCTGSMKLQEDGKTCVR